MIWIWTIFNIPVLAWILAFLINADPCCRSISSPWSLSAATSIRATSLEMFWTRKNTFFFHPENHAHQYVNTIKIQTCVKMLNTQAIPTWPIPTTVTLLTDLVLDSVTSEKSCCFMVSIWWIYKIGFLFEHKILEFAKSCSTEIEIESESQRNLPSKCLL